MPPSRRWVAQPATSVAAATVTNGRRRRRTGSRARRHARLVPPGQLLEHVVNGDAAGPEQNDGVKPEVRDFLHDPTVAFTTEGRGDDLGRLLTDLAGDGGFAAREQPGHVRAGRRCGLTRLHDVLETLDHRRPRRTFLDRGEEARPIPGVTRHALLMHP